MKKAVRLRAAFFIVVVVSPGGLKINGQNPPQCLQGSLQGRYCLPQLVQISTRAPEPDDGLIIGTFRTGEHLPD